MAGCCREGPLGSTREEGSISIAACSRARKIAAAPLKMPPIGSSGSSATRKEDAEGLGVHWVARSSPCAPHALFRRTRECTAGADQRAQRGNQRKIFLRSQMHGKKCSLVVVEVGTRGLRTELALALEPLGARDGRSSRLQDLNHPAARGPRKIDERVRRGQFARDPKLRGRTGSARPAAGPQVGDFVLQKIQVRNPHWHCSSARN